MKVSTSGIVIQLYGIASLVIFITHMQGLVQVAYQVEKKKDLHFYFFIRKFIFDSQFQDRVVQHMHDVRPFSVRRSESFREIRIMVRLHKVIALVALDVVHPVRRRLDRHAVKASK